MKYKIVSHNDKYWPEVYNLIKNHWRKDHPVLNYNLFQWQHRGYDPYSDYSTLKLLFLNKELVDIRGCIPGFY